MLYLVRKIVHYTHVAEFNHFYKETLFKWKNNANLLTIGKILLVLVIFIAITQKTENV